MGARGNVVGTARELEDEGIIGGGQIAPHADNVAPDRLVSGVERHRAAPADLPVPALNICDGFAHDLEQIELESGTNRRLREEPRLFGKRRVALHEIVARKTLEPGPETRSVRELQRKAGLADGLSFC